MLIKKPAVMGFLDKRGALRLCAFCDQPAAFQCDQMRLNGKGLCERFICLTHSTAIGALHDFHLCPHHKPAVL